MCLLGQVGLDQPSVLQEDLSPFFIGAFVLGGKANIEFLQW